MIKDKIIENETTNLSLYSLFLDNKEKLKLSDKQLSCFLKKKQISELRIRKRKQALIIQQIEFVFSLVAIVLYISKIIIYVIQRKGFLE